MADTKAPPAPSEASVYTPEVPAAPAPVVTADWTKPAAEEEPKPAPRKSSRRRGIPAGPALAAAGNAATLAATSAYQAAGWPGLAAAGGVLLAGGAASVAKRRATVKRRRLSAKAGRGGDAGSWPSSRSSRTGGGSAGGSLLAGGGAKSSRSAPGPGGRDRSESAPSRDSGPGARKRSGSPQSALNRIADRLLGGDGKTLKDRSAKTKKDEKKQKAAHAQQSRLARTAKAARKRAAKAWAADKPRRQRNRAAAKAALRRTRTAGGHALRAVGSGIWGSIRHLSLRHGAARAWATWKARHTKRTTADPQPTVASTVRRPTATTTTPSPGGPTMSGHHFVAGAMEMARAAANYQPTGMIQVIDDFGGLQEALQLVAEAMKVTVENADARFPLDPRLIESMKQIHMLQLKASELAKELKPAAMSLHQADLQRHQSPRKGRMGERMWDIASN